MLNNLYKTTQQRMHQSTEALKNEFGKIRTGRANPGLIEHITVSYYGSDMPLNQVASISAEDRNLLVTPWEKGMVEAVEKAIRAADLGLNPSSAGQVIRVPMPMLTEETRRNLTKLIKEEGEKAKISVRNVRRDALAQTKEWLKAKTISEDDDHRAHTQLQKITDEAIAEIDAMVTKKTTDIMTL